MKKRLCQLIMILAVIVFAAGCGISTFTFTTRGNNSEISVKSASDGAVGESYVIEVGKGRSVLIESSLESGQLQIDFAEAINMTVDPDEPDDYMIGDVVASVTVGEDQTETVKLDPGEYVMQVTAIGKTNGTIAVTVVKSE